MLWDIFCPYGLLFQDASTFQGFDDIGSFFIVILFYLIFWLGINKYVSRWSLPRTSSKIVIERYLIAFLFLRFKRFIISI